MLMRRTTFTSSQRFWMVSARSSEKTSTTKRSGGQEPGSRDSWESIGNIFLGELKVSGSCGPFCEMPLTYLGKLTEVPMSFLPAPAQMYSVAYAVWLVLCLDIGTY